MLKEFMSEQSNYTIYTPNEIFEDLLNSDIKPAHQAFAYTYYFTISYLYRHHSYHHVLPTVEDLKVYLQLNPRYQAVDYIIKKGGVLDKLGYTETTTNYPIAYEYDEDGVLTYDCVKDQSELIREPYLARHNNRYSIKVPLKAFARLPLKYPDDLDGTFYDTSNTHATELYIMNYMMSNCDLGCTAFYIYQFLKYKCDKSNSVGLKGYDLDYERFSEMIGLSEKTINKYTLLLRKWNCISVEKGNSFNGIANRYILNDFSKFR